MGNAVRRVVIVGGGTAGWLTAGVIAAKHKARIESGDLSVSLIESPDIPIIGVGEGTWPTLRSTLEAIGVSETDFFRECDAAFKQGAKFARWTTGAEDDYYYHPFVMPEAFMKVNLAPHWISSQTSVSFCDMVANQGRICEIGLAPKNITTPEYQGLVNYAYHLDANKFSVFLTRHVKNNLGVRHILANVQEVVLSTTGDISVVRTPEAGDITGDLFVDCTGGSSLLLGKALNVPFRDCRDILFCDTALAVQIPYDDPNDAIASHTISTAQTSGWIWDIGLQSRRGIGHVFSSSHTSVQSAEDELAKYVGPKLEQYQVRKIGIRSGYRTVRWKNNCVAVGMAAGFLEPLEASAIVLIEISAKWIAKQLPACREVMEIAASRFNEMTDYHWQRIVEFLKLHYVLTQRTDSSFWTDNLEPASIPPRLRDQLLFWKYHPPGFLEDFDRVEEMFPPASYQYVLYGMGFRTEVNPNDLQSSSQIANRAFSENLSATRRLVDQLPSHRDLLQKIRKFGMQPI